MLLKISVHRHYPAIHMRHFLVCAYHLANPKGKVRLVIFPYFFSHFMNEPVKNSQFFCYAYNAGHEFGIFCVLDANWEYLLGSFFHVFCIDLLISNVTRFKISLSQSTYNIYICTLECGTWYHHPRRLQCFLSRNLRIFKVATWHCRCRHNLKNNCIWDNLQCCLLVPRSPSKPVMLTFDLQSRKVLFIEIVFWHV